MCELLYILTMVSVVLLSLIYMDKNNKDKRT